MYWYWEAMRKYAVFSGRARRKEYWLFHLINGILCLVLGALVAFVGRAVIEDPVTLIRLAAGVLMLYMLATIIPSLAVLVRRLHDINRSGLWLLISLVPFGGLVLLIFACIDSDPGPNQYGPNPKREGFNPQAAWAASASYGPPGSPEIGRPAKQGMTPQLGTTAPQAFCTNCGTPLLPGTRFCTGCGSAAY